MFSIMTCDKPYPEIPFKPAAVTSVVWSAPAPLITRHGLPLKATVPSVAGLPAKHPALAGAIPDTSIAPLDPGRAAVCAEKSNTPEGILITYASLDGLVAAK